MAYGTSDMYLYIAVRVAALKTSKQLPAHTQWTYPEQNIKQKEEIFQTYGSTCILSLIPCLHSEKTKKKHLHMATWQTTQGQAPEYRPGRECRAVNSINERRWKWNAQRSGSMPDLHNTAAVKAA